jgi:hypothetical protein
MTLPRSVADVLSDHVAFELESIDRLLCNLYVPQLQRAEGIVGFIRGHLGQPIASTAVIAPMSRDFTARLRSFADAHDVPRLDFARGQRKDDVMHQHLAAFGAAGRREGVLFIGRAQVTLADTVHWLADQGHLRVAQAAGGSPGDKARPEPGADA